MGRIWRFLNQDASKAVDRVAVPYVRFVTSHTLVMWTIYAIVVAVVWVFVSRSLALIILGAWVVLLFYGAVLALRRRRG